MTSHESAIKTYLEESHPQYAELVRYLYDHPETGNEEWLAQEQLTKMLTGLGFCVTKGAATPTDFVGVYDSGKPGPVLAYLCEYDALPVVGHGCGHNLIAGISLAAAAALKQVIDQTGGTLQVMGCPAEENFGGKISLAEAGLFNGVDCAMMLHPSSVNGLGGRSLALIPERFVFHGKSAHASRAWEGASALDAGVSTFNLLNQLRQFVKPGTNIQGVITDGGKAANVIPETAQLDYYFRAPSMAYCKEVQAKALTSAQAAAQAAGVQFSHYQYETAYDDCLMNYTLGELLQEAFATAGLTEIEAIVEEPIGSTDVGAVSYRCPTIQGKIKICGSDVPAHTSDFAAATVSDAGSKALLDGAFSLALLGLRLLTDPQALAKVQKEFQDSKPI